MDVACRLGLGEAQLGLTSFVACGHPVESCGHNGLPLTPNSIRILGQAEVLKSLCHPNLCSYLHFQRGKNERLLCISEHYDCNLTLLNRDDSRDEEEFYDNLYKIALGALGGLRYLDANGIVHINLRSVNILLTSSDVKVKLFDYGMGHVTNYGECVAFPLFEPRCTAPEVFARGPIKAEKLSSDSDDEVEADDSITHIAEAPEPPYDRSASLWSLGMILAAKCLGMKSEKELWPQLKVPQVIRKILNLAHCEDVLQRVAREHGCQTILPGIPDKLRSLIERCLQSDPSQRLDLSDSIYTVAAEESVTECYTSSFPTLQLRCRDLVWPPCYTALNSESEEEDEQPLDLLTIQETFYLWQLAGGDPMAELRKHGLLSSLPPTLTLPRVVLREGHCQGQIKERCTLYNPDQVVQLSLAQLKSCLDSLMPNDLYPLLGLNDQERCQETANLPLVIKERDVRYQFGRVVLYRKLLQSYPYLRPSIWKESRVDALPLYRSFIWAALLGIEHHVQHAYDQIDKEAWTPTDRQIEVDIPRCHQYNHLLASPEGHRKFKRVLKAWVVTNPQYVYWQGLDSLCAPFLYLNFNNEALAFACLSAFIPKYLHGMFRQDNAAVIREYLAKFSHIQAFHDPVLFNHLDGIGFIPDLYAIPWVLTMFAHVFPLQNIFHLWDKLILGNSAFPLCVALAILYQLRERLLDAEFNDCILLFSDLPAIDIEQCVKDSIQIFCATPKSLTFRKYGSKQQEITSESDMYSDLTLHSITLEEQRDEKVPRVSGEELLILLGHASMVTRKSHSEDSSQDVLSPSSHKKSRVLTIDVRPQADYKLGTLPDAINVPYNSAFDQQGQFVTHEKLLGLRRGKILCIVGSTTNKWAQEFAAKLLSLDYNRVCVLHNGIEIFRSVGILCVPNT